jgi:hypothetical protein
MSTDCEILYLSNDLFQSIMKVHRFNFIEKFFGERSLILKNSINTIERTQNIMFGPLPLDQKETVKKPKQKNKMIQEAFDVIKGTKKSVSPRKRVDTPPVVVKMPSHHMKTLSSSVENPLRLPVSTITTGIKLRTDHVH